MITAFAAFVALTVLTAVGFGCYGLYRIECAVAGFSPAKWFGR